jgi:hypothetical protein
MRFRFDTYYKKERALEYGLIAAGISVAIIVIIQGLGSS